MRKLLKHNPPKTPQELRELIDRGAQVRSLLASQVWLKELEPLINGRIRNLEMASPWHPEEGKASCEAIALGCAYTGGGVRELNNILKHLRNVLAAGASAAEELKKLEEPKK